jgi:hypothetical protein
VNFSDIYLSTKDKNNKENDLLKNTKHKGRGGFKVRPVWALVWAQLNTFLFV